MRPLLLILATAMLAGAEEIRTGFYTVAFSERSPQSAFEVLGKRYAWSKPEARDLYDIAKEDFEVNVPASYDGSTAYGLVVYTNSGKGGNARAYAELMGKYRLIWIGATNVPNERAVAVRFGLALDAAWNMARRYRIDPRRVYASGFSGGGRCSSMLVPTWPEVFSGGIYLCGCNAPTMPADKALAAKSLLGRFALLTGSDDFNRQDTQGVLQAYKNLGFKQVQFFEQPGLGHATPAAEWFEKGLQACDRPLIDEAAALVAQGQALEAKKPYEAAQCYRKVLGEYPVAEQAGATARERFAQLSPAVDALLRAELAKLAGAGKDRWRAMAERAAGFPCADEARAGADALGAKELEALMASPGSGTPAKLRKLREEWKGYPCAGRADEAYEGLAAKALEPLLAYETGKRARALAKYLKEWEDGPSRVRASTQLEEDLAQELEPLLALDKAKGRATRLGNFIKSWPGTRAAARAQEALESGGK